MPYTKPDEPKREPPQWWLLWLLLGFMAVLVLMSWGLLRLATMGT